MFPGFAFLFSVHLQFLLSLRWDSCLNLKSYIATVEEKLSISEKVLRIKLESAIEAYKNDRKCSCENDIRVVGSACDGFKCFQCITGKKRPAGDYEKL